MIKKGLYFCLLAGIIIMLFNWQLLEYGFMQAKGQYMVVSNAKPLDYFKEQASFPDSLKEKIADLEKIKAFATGKFELPAENQYNSLYDQKGEDILWVVTACEPYSLKSYEWSFPLLGKVSYKGFFVFKKAEEAFSMLEKEGLDVRIRPVNAWSTLGWFDDPLLSKMLQRRTARLAEVVFHELIHDVVYLKDSTDFNENLATFIARELTSIYLSNGNFSEKEIKEYHNSLDDLNLLYSFMNAQVLSMDSIYKVMGSFSAEEKSKTKEALFRQLKVSLSDKEFHNENIINSIVNDSTFNNAHLMAYKRYGGMQTILKKQLVNDFGGDILKMLKYYQHNFNNI